MPQATAVRLEWSVVLSTRLRAGPSPAPTTPTIRRATHHGRRPPHQPHRHRLVDGPRGPRRPHSRPIPPSTGCSTATVKRFVDMPSRPFAMKMPPTKSSRNSRMRFVPAAISGTSIRNEEGSALRENRCVSVDCRLPTTHRKKRGRETPMHSNVAEPEADSPESKDRR